VIRINKRRKYPQKDPGSSTEIYKALVEKYGPVQYRQGSSNEFLWRPGKPGQPLHTAMADDKPIPGWSWCVSGHYDQSSLVRAPHFGWFIENCGPTYLTARIEGLSFASGYSLTLYAPVLHWISENAAMRARDEAQEKYTAEQEAKAKSKPKPDL